MSTEKDKEEIIQFEPVDITTIYNQDKAVVDMQITTAKTYPRNIKRSVENALAIVTLDQNVAASCHYALPRGGKHISGPSTHLAKIILQNWGNIRAEAEVIAEDAKTVTSQAICWDLETNVAVKVKVKRSIMTKTGRMNDDMIVVTGNAANSIAMRNAIFNVIPKGVVDNVYAAAKQMITGDVSDKAKLLARRKQVFDGLMQTYDLTEKEILAVIGRAAIDHVVPDDLVNLIGIAQSIKDLETTVDIAFRGGKTAKPADITKEELQEAYNLKGEFLSEEDKIHIERILKNEEVESYKKAMETIKKLNDVRP